MTDSQNIINLDDGWNVEIKKKALDPLEVNKVYYGIVSASQSLITTAWSEDIPDIAGETNFISTSTIFSSDE